MRSRALTQVIVSKNFAFLIKSEHRGALNTRFDETHSFERKIEELNFGKDLCRVMLSAEVERLHGVISEKIAENEVLHEHLDKLERAHEPEQLEGGNLSGESLFELSPGKAQELEKQNRDLKFKTEEYEAQVDALKKEINNLIQDNVAKDRELARWRANLEGVQTYSSQKLPGRSFDEQRRRSSLEAGDFDGNREKGEMDGLIASLQEKNVEYENRMVLFVIEIERLLQEKNELADTVEVLKGQMNKKEKEFNHQMKSLKDYYESGKNENFEDQVRDSTAKLNAEKSVIEYQLSNVRGRLEDLEAREHELQNEVEKYRKEALEKESEAEAWKSKYNFLEKRHNSEIEDLKGDLEYRVRERVDLELSDLNLKFAQERSYLESAVVKLKNRVQDYENRLVLFIFEIERLQNVAMDRMQETGRLKEMMDGKEQSYEEGLEALRQELDKALQNKIESEIEAQHEAWQRERATLEETLQRQLDEINRLRGDIKKYFGDQLDPRDQVRQQEVFYRLRSEVSDLEIKSIMLMIEIERLNSVVQIQNMELEDVHRDNIILAETLEQVAPEVARNLPVK